jgi:hypothetical protein
MNRPRSPDREAFRVPSREFGILPFWFLNGELDPDEMRGQLRELRDKGMHGVVLHGRYGLEMPYLGPEYLDRVRLGVEEANRLGLAAWIYDEMNWPSGTADKRVPAARPDLAQRYLECVSFTITGPWFMCLTGEDSRYLDFERSTPVAAFAIGRDGGLIDLTPNLSFGKVVPWEVPPGEWRLCYLVEKRADYYIDAMNPESTAEFLRLGYAPYVDALGDGARDAAGRSVVGFYSDEPAMHYFLTAGDNPIVPWTKDMFRRFRDRNGYDLRSRLAHLFFDLGPESAQTRHDFYSTTTAFYSDAYYRQIHDWCGRHGVLFTAHLLYEEWLRMMVRVEGNLFRHYEHLDVTAVDHLYPVIGTRAAPDQHVAIKVASSAAHHNRSPRLICESFGGIFMDATMQRMKWIADWEYVLGVTLLNPHGFHYTLEGARKRDWPPSMFYQYPWWPYYGKFSEYISRLSETLSGGRHAAKVAVIWPIHSMFASYLPQTRTAESTVTEAGLNVLTDLLLRLHHDFDYLDEEVLARSEVEGGRVRVADEAYELVLIPPMTYLRGATLDALERFVAGGGKVLGVLQAPRAVFRDQGVEPAEERIRGLFGGAFVRGDVGAVIEGPGEGRERLRDALDAAIRSLITPDVDIDNDELFSLHRTKDGRDVLFVVNPTFEQQKARVSLRAAADAVLWDPTSGEERPVEPAGREGEGTGFDIVLPPVGSVLVVTGDGVAGTEQERFTPSDTIEIDGPWRFEAEDANALVVQRWRATPEEEGEAPASYSDPDLDDSGWLEVVAGAWAYQLPAEPARAWPVPVWYRIAFDVEEPPEDLRLLVDGFDGTEPGIWLNGEEVSATPRRSAIDAQMREVDLSRARRGRNVLAVRLVLHGPTGGLVDHVKLLGSFGVAGDVEHGFRITAPPDDVRPGSWTDQGFPFYSGRGVYRTRVMIPEDHRRVLVEIPMRDDVVEVGVNGSPVGVCLWDPYVVEITGHVRPGQNELALRVANTPANLLGGTPRPSGLAGAPRVLVERGGS